MHEFYVTYYYLDAKNKLPTSVYSKHHRVLRQMEK